MGAYGSPELFPNNITSQTLKKKLKTSQVIIAIFSIVICFILSIFLLSSLPMLINLLSNGVIVTLISIICIFTFIICSILFIKGYVKRLKYKKQLIVLISSFFIFLLTFGFIPSSTLDSNKVYSDTINNNTQDIDISKCLEYNYKDIARNPNNYINKPAKFTGQVMQVLEQEQNVMLLVNVTKNEYGLYSDTIYVNYQKKSTTESRTLEGDIVTLYGSLNGITTYTSLMNQSITVPHLIAQRIDFIE